MRGRWQITLFGVGAVAAAVLLSRTSTDSPDTVGFATPFGARHEGFVIYDTKPAKVIGFAAVSADTGSTAVNLYCETTAAARVQFRYVKNTSGDCSGTWNYPWSEGSTWTAVGTSHGKQISGLTHSSCYQFQIRIYGCPTWASFTDGLAGPQWRTLGAGGEDPPDPESP